MGIIRASLLTACEGFLLGAKVSLALRGSDGDRLIIARSRHMIDARLTFFADIALDLPQCGGRGSGGGGGQVPDLLGIRRAEFSPPKVRARYSRGISTPAHSPRLADLAWFSLGTYLRE